jgi:tetratricopeptide (TPR) repeat protein
MVSLNDGRESAMFCSQCGAKVPDEGGFCPECGTPVAAPETTAAAPAAPETAVAPTDVAVPPFAPLPESTPDAPGPLAAPAFVPAPTPPPETAASYPPPAPFAQPASEAPKKSKKKLFIILGAVVLVVVLAVATFVGFSLWRASVYDQGVTALAEESYWEAHDLFSKLGDYKNAQELADSAWQGLEYEAALELLHAKDYATAKQSFEALGDFKDAAEKALLCQQHIDYQAAAADFEKGDFERALEVFAELADAKFEDAVQWRDKSSYAIAEGKYKAEDYYGAYQIFKDLGSFEDSAERAQQCTTALPATGELYHNGDYVSTVSALVINGSNTTYPSYYKLYAGGTLVATFFLNPGGSCTVELPPGDYQIKEAAGDVWFGEEVMFGDEGEYVIMTFDGGEDYFTLEYNIELTITLSVIGELSGDSVGSDPTTREGF